MLEVILHILSVEYNGPIRAPSSFYIYLGCSRSLCCLGHEHGELNEHHTPHDPCRNLINDRIKYFMALTTE